MFPAATINPPPVNTGSEAALLILILNVPDLPERRLMAPAANFIGTRLLGHLVEVEMERSGQLAAPATFHGEFNSCMVYLPVNNPHTAAQTLQRVLTENILINFAGIYYYDPREHIFRCLFPNIGSAIMPDEFKKKVRVLVAATQSMCAQMASIMAELIRQQPPKNTGDTGSDPGK